MTQPRILNIFEAFFAHDRVIVPKTTIFAPVLIYRQFLKNNRFSWKKSHFCPSPCTEIEKKLHRLTSRSSNSRVPELREACDACVGSLLQRFLAGVAFSTFALFPNHWNYYYTHLELYAKIIVDEASMCIHWQLWTFSACRKFAIDICHRCWVAAALHAATSAAESAAMLF